MLDVIFALFITVLLVLTALRSEADQPKERTFLSVQIMLIARKSPLHNTAKSGATHWLAQIKRLPRNDAKASLKTTRCACRRGYLALALYDLLLASEMD